MLFIEALEIRRGTYKKAVMVGALGVEEVQGLPATLHERLLSLGKGLYEPCLQTWQSGVLLYEDAGRFQQCWPQTTKQRARVLVLLGSSRCTSLSHRWGVDCVHVRGHFPPRAS